MATKRKLLAEMDPKEARKAIARDVISLLKSRRFRAKPGTYFELSTNEKGLDGGDDLRSAVGRKRCDVCAIGAAIVARALREDRIKVRDATTGSLYTLADIFDPQQLRSMEGAFEVDETTNGGCQCDQCVAARRFPKSAKFGKKFKEPGRRLLAIWENVLKNDGEFIP